MCSRFCALLIAFLALSTTSLASPPSLILVTNTNPDGPGSLRQAILDANAHAGPDSIAFSISPPGPAKIRMAPYCQLPFLDDDDTVIDGFTQPGASPNTNNIGDNSNAVWGVSIGLAIHDCPGASETIVLAGNRCKVRGFSISNAEWNVEVDGDDCVIEGCGIGYGSIGVALYGSRDRVGGNTNASRVTLDELGTGIAVRGPSARIMGNHIKGCDTAIAVQNATGTVIGGASGTPCLMGHAANLITENAGDGVNVSNSPNTSILSNMIRDNGGAGIASDEDQDIRVDITHASGKTVTGLVRTGSGPAIYRVEVFDNSSCDPSGTGEGKIFFGSTNVSTNVNGRADFTLTCGSVNPGRYFTATVTTMAGRTSEFSPCFTSAVTAVDEMSRNFALEDNVPNPFNPSTVIPYRLAEATRVHIAVYSAAGVLMKTLVDGVRQAGEWNVPWNGEDERGARVSSGVYFCRMRAGAFDQTRKMVLLK
jgi:hypothetical protein